MSQISIEHIVQNLPDEACLDAELVNFVLDQIDDYSNIILPQPLQAELFKRTLNPIYHQAWYTLNRPEPQYLDFAASNLRESGKAICHWFDLEDECPDELVLYIVRVLSNVAVAKQDIEPCFSVWHMYCFVHQLLEFDEFHPKRQLAVIDTLQRFSDQNTKHVNIVIRDEKAVILQWMLRSDCYSWKSYYVIISN
eukprot:NODE_44_length_33449_cov_1.575742.p25 type:complete len:195 gc:universal NODE_44_length_33449_cov_1.575742:31419-32003(+)